MSKGKIVVEGESYKVIDTLPYCQAGACAKLVRTADGERVAVKRGGVWVWWTAKDRLVSGGAYIGMSERGTE